jgi:predicted oxidoreductase
VARFQRHGEDFLTSDNLETLIRKMKALTNDGLLDAARVAAEVEARDREVENGFCKDAQLAAIRNARLYRGDRLVRVVRPHRIVDPKAGPLIAVRLWILTRKTLGGLETDLSSRVLRPDGVPLGNLFAAGEVAGFGGGGMHGYRSLEGTFLGGCLFSGRIAGRAAAQAVG